MCYQEIYLVAGQINEVKKQNVLYALTCVMGISFITTFEKYFGKPHKVISADQN